MFRSRIHLALMVVTALTITAVVAASPPLVSAPWAVRQVAQFTWQRVSSTALGGDGDQVITAVIWDHRGLVAVGSETTAGDTNAAVWISSDGLSWYRVDDDGFTGASDQVATGVVRDADTTVVVGYEESDTGRDAAVWVADPHWHRVASAAFTGPGEQSMLALATTGAGLVAVGSSGGDAAVWTSPDGLVWARALVGGPGSQVMRAIGRGPFGLVAAGYDAPAGDRDAAVWTSGDGRLWQRAPHDEATFGGPDWQEARGVGFVDGNPVVAGWDDSEAYADAAVWVGDRDWRRLPHRAAFGNGGDQEMHAITSGGGGPMVAVGVDWQGDGDAAAWMSYDGLVWVRLSAAGLGGPDDQKALAVASWGSRTVAVGYDFSSGDQDGAIWIVP